MSSHKIVAVLLLAVYCQCSVLAPAPVVSPGIRYIQVAPQNIRPFAAQVSTFTKGLNIYAAPFAAGVLSGPAIVPKTLLPPPAIVPGYSPAPLYPSPLAPVLGPSAPIYPAPFAPAVAPAPFAPALAPVQFGPSVSPVPFAPAVAPAFYPSSVAQVASPPLIPAGVVAPSPLLPAPFARSVHAVAPGYVPHAAQLAPAVPALSRALPSTTLWG